jgi:uncharacterized membrane protein (DUF4010 family)
LLLGYVGDMRRDNNVSVTSTLAGILTLALGSLATTGHMALASVCAGVVVILLASRAALHHAIRMTSAEDIKALARLVLVAFVILPLLPDTGMGPYHALNPIRIWTVVVITGSVSFFGYLLVRWLGDARGALVTAAVGSLVSSTAVTLDAGRRIREGAADSVASASVAVASAIMLLRSLVLVALVAPMALAHFALLVGPGLAMSGLGAAILIWRERGSPAAPRPNSPKAPGLGLALLFSASVAVLSVATVWAQGIWGSDRGAFLIALGGTFDIDAAIAAVGALPPGSLAPRAAAAALAAPTLLNTLFKLVLFIAAAGLRRALLGAAALALVAISLIVPIAIALL